ncbi:hypothetical protein [Anaerosolibacter sp.]|uniref:hypothetical protein n=1 Tax=Anaerosolibacter sp. TaxID=1872527 RepID=UPI0039F08D9A
MFKKMDQDITKQYQSILNTNPFLTGHCHSWELGEGLFRYESEDVTLIRMDRDGNYQCYSVEVEK